MIKYPKWCFWIGVAISAMVTISTSKPLLAQEVSTSTEEFGNLGLGPRVPNFCSLTGGSPCLSINLNQGFSFPDSGTNTNFAVVGDVLLNNRFSFVGGGATTIDADAANLFASVVARSRVKEKGFGYAIGPVLRLGYGRDDVTTTTFIDGSTTTERNDRAFFGVGGTAQLLYKPLDTLVFWTGIDASQNVFDGGGIVFSVFGGSAFTIANTAAGVLGGTIAISRTDGDIGEETNSFNVGVVLFP